jgi:membrane-bound lytic murein transglycosylase D
VKKLFLISFLFCITSWSAIKPWTSTLPDDSIFTPSEELSERVDFWMKIYAHYDTNQGVFHLVDDPSFVLGEVDLNPIMENSVLSAAEKKHRADRYLSAMKNDLVQKWKISDSRKVRLQMGLKDRMEKAFFISGRYLPMMEDIFRKKGLPIELTRIVFVESSFNVNAYSKVGASGLWQIMPSVARPHGYIQKQYDKRNHPIYATRLAADILEQNYRGLGSWPLAITAYNHGLTGVKRMVERSNSEFIEDLIDSDNGTRSWGFASKNFYACFLAVLEVERNASALFGGGLMQSKKLSYREIKLSKTVAKAKILKAYNGSLTRFRQMNPHLNWSLIIKKKKIPAGTPLIVPKEKYHLVSMFKI